MIGPLAFLFLLFDNIKIRYSSSKLISLYFTRMISDAILEVALPMSTFQVDPTKKQVDFRFGFSMERYAKMQNLRNYETDFMAI